MSAPTLSISEQKEAISGKKKKKKTMKNILGIPSNLKIQCQTVEVRETEKLNTILERLLPSARLPVQQNSKSDRDSNKDTINESELITEIKNKRNQLSLGVNALSRSIKKDLISAVLLAADIQPRFLVHHLNILCSHNKIPFLHLPGLRNITKNNLGFPCIALGFKKNHCDFSEAVEEIKLIAQNKKFGADDTAKSSTESSTEESEEEEELCNEITVKEDEIPFTYLMRSSVKERIFVPGKCNKEETKEKADFITLGEDINEVRCQDNQQDLGISSHLIKKRKSKLKEIKIKDVQSDDDDDDDDDEDLEVPKKKAKKDWVIDKVGTRQNYYPVRLMRVPSNPDRNRKK